MLNKVKEYIEGNVKYYKDKFFNSADFIKEQIYFRLNECKDDCLIENKCRNCTCPPRKKVWVSNSCNPNRFPDLMNKPDWEAYKEEHNINVNDFIDEL